MALMLSLICRRFCVFQFKRASAQEIQFLTVNQDDLTALSIAEELQKQQDEMHPHQGSGKVKVAAQFWNSSTGQMESTADASDLARRKAQINTLASSAAAMEVELARQRQAGYAKRDSARKKYGW